MDNNLWSVMSLEKSAEIDGRKIWLYRIETCIGTLCVVQYEEKTKEITEYIIRHDLKKAETKYQKILVSIARGLL